MLQGIKPGVILHILLTRVVFTQNKHFYIIYISILYFDTLSFRLRLIFLNFRTVTRRSTTNHSRCRDRRHICPATAASTAVAHRASLSAERCWTVQVLTTKSSTLQTTCAEGAPISRASYLVQNRPWSSLSSPLRRLDSPSRLYRRGRS